MVNIITPNITKNKENHFLQNYMNKCFIIGGGPSLKEMDLNPIKNEFVIGTNAAFRLGTWIDINFILDCRCITWNWELLKKWPNRIVTTCKTYKNCPPIEYLTACTKHGICFEERKLAVPDKGKNCGATAINLAIKEGFKTIILLGFDMEVKNGQHNYHSHHKIVPRDDVYNRFQIHFKRIAEELPDDVEILNATPDSKLKYFKKVSYEEVCG